MHVLIAGSSGFLGGLLTAALRERGHAVTPLVRRPAAPEERHWDPYAGPVDPRVVDGVDVVVNLAGSPTVGNPHSSRWARDLEHSRVSTTRALAEAIAGAEVRPALLAGNGISVHGDHGAAEVDEFADSRGDALLTRVTRAWRDAAEPAAAAGARVAVLHTAPVLDGRSAPMRQLRLLFRAGLGGRLGNGRQFFPVISARDWVSGVCAVAEGGLSGPVNLCCPVTPTNAEFTRTLARALHRPAVVPVPAAAIRLAAGAMAPEVLGSVRAVPRVLMKAGHTFLDRDVEAVVSEALRH